MTTISTQDWDALGRLAAQVALPAERVSQLRKRLEGPGDRPGGPHVLLAGRPDAGIELVLGRWLATEAAAALAHAGASPLVIGATPGDVQPRVGRWPTWRAPRYGPGHLVALSSGGRPGADVLAQLASLGYMDQLVLVSRLAQPIHQHERALVSSLAGLAATARVLLVALPGEEPTSADLAEVVAHAAAALRQEGFGHGRCRGVGVWFTGGQARPGTITDLGAFLAVDTAAVAAGRAGMSRQALTGLVADLRQRAEQAPAAQPALPPDEQDRLVNELKSYLADLGRELARQAEKRRPLTADTLRTYARDAVRGWGAYTGVEGHWMKYVERVRPGLQAAFLAEVEAALPLLDLEDVTLSPPEPPAAAPPSAAADAGVPVDRLVIEAKRLAGGLVCGLAVYLATVTPLGGSAEQPGALAPAVVSILGYAGLAIGTVLGYSAGRRIFRLGAASKAGEKTLGPPAAPLVHGWEQLTRRVLAWFAEQIRQQPASAAEKCRALAIRFGIQEEHP
jgi:hypothetical protein